MRKSLSHLDQHHHTIRVLFIRVGADHDHDHQIRIYPRAKKVEKLSAAQSMAISKKVMITKKTLFALGGCNFAMMKKMQMLPWEYMQPTLVCVH